MRHKRSAAPSRSRAGNSFIASSLDEIATAAERIAASGRPVGRLPQHRHDEFGRLSMAFNTMIDRLAESYAELENRVAERTRESEESRSKAEKSANLLREAVSSIAQGFTIYDEEDRLVLCNEAYLRLYEASRDLIVTGASFEEIVRRGAERGQYSAAIGRVDAWVRQRVAEHQSARGEVIEQQLGDDRWLMIVEYRTPSGYIVGNRIDITELKRSTEELRLRALHQRATLDNLPFLFWFKDCESRFLAANKAYSDSCGRASPEELMGLSDFDIWPPAIAERFRADDLEVMAKRRETAVEERIDDSAGCRWIETFKKPVVAPDGTLLGTVGFSRDISERKRMEDALATSEQRWELAVNGANDGIWDWNVETGQIYFTERWKTMLGFAAGDFRGHIDEWRELVHPDDSLRVLEAMQRHLAGETEFYEIELRMRCKDGGYKWILCRGKAAFDASGRPVRMSGSHTDVTQRHAAESRIREHSEQLKSIFALSPDGFVSFDVTRCVSYVSPAFTRLTGLDPGDVIDLDEAAFSARLAGICTAQARFSGIAALRAMQKVARGASRPSDAGGSAGDRRQRIELAGAGRRMIEVGLRESETETVAQILYLRDITHETEVDRLKSEFLSTAAHELRTPMASIYGFAELLLSQDFDEADRRDFIGTIFRQSELMVSIINELLDLARIEARRGKDFNIARIEIGALLREITAGFKTPDQRPAPLQAATSAPLWVRADRNKLTQALSNVLSNAYKYSPAGGAVSIGFVLPGVDTPSAGGGAPLIGIRISDQGIGMTPQQLCRVFERFYRADTSGRIPGTGLGMSIVKEIVELHGGEVAIESALGTGTTVTLWLPAADKIGGTAAAAADA